MSKPGCKPGQAAYPASFKRRAKRMRANGRTYVEIAERLGVNRNTVIMWCNPDFALADHRRQVEWKANNADRLRVYQARKRTTTCTDCGQPKTGKVDGLCRECVQRAARERDELLVRLWDEGLTYRQIADRLDSTKANVAVRLSTLRKQGWPVGYRTPNVRCTHREGAVAA